jgi:hypothetical protein
MEVEPQIGYMTFSKSHRLHVSDQDSKSNIPASKVKIPPSHPNIFPLVAPWDFTPQFLEGCGFSNTNVSSFPGAVAAGTFSSPVLQYR